MIFQIKRVKFSDLTYNSFMRDFLLPEIPVIIEDTQCFDGAVLTPEYIKLHFEQENRREMGWFDADLVNDDVITIPHIVEKILSAENMAVRSAPMRIFMQPKGHITLPHYDGNSLHGLNLQVKGQKKWIITSPHTPLPTMPFMFAALVKRDFFYDPKKYEYAEFTTSPGDMVFIPRYWTHEVHSQQDVNLNINWVFTPRKPNLKSPLGRREVEIIRMRRDFPFVNKAFFPDKFNNYGGQGKILIDAYAKDVGLINVVTRLIKELIKYPKLLMLANEMRSKANDFSKNNFNV